MRDGFEDEPEDMKLVAEFFMPEAVKAGSKIIYFIIGKDNSLNEELEGQESDSADKITFKYIYEFLEIV